MIPSCSLPGPHEQTLSRVNRWNFDHRLHRPRRQRLPRFHRRLPVDCIAPVRMRHCFSQSAIAFNSVVVHTEATHWLTIPGGRHRHVVGFVAKINAGGMGMHHFPSEVFSLCSLRLSSPRCLRRGETLQRICRLSCRASCPPDSKLH